MEAQVYGLLRGGEMKDGSFSRSFQARRSKRRGAMPNESLIRAITQIIHPTESIIDMGAGTGSYVRYLRELGYSITGIDGTKEIENLTDDNVFEQSLTESCEAYYGCAYWGLLIEVGEHVPRELESRFLLEVSKIPTTGMIVSWAPPRQRGTGHVNCRPAEYVIEKFALLGWHFDEVVTKEARALVDHSYKNKLMVLNSDV